MIINTYLLFAIISSPEGNHIVDYLISFEKNEIILPFGTEAK